MALLALNAQPAERNPLTREGRRRLWTRINTYLRENGDPITFTRGWFYESPVLHSLCLADVRSWLAWALFDTRIAELSPEESTELDEHVQALETSIASQQGVQGNFRFRGSSDDFGGAYHQHALSTVTALRWRPLPFAFYLVSAAADEYAAGYFCDQGFKVHKINTYRVFVKQGSRAGAGHQMKAPPTIFVHGIGIGLVANLKLIECLEATCGDAGFAVIEMLHLSARLEIRQPSISEAAATLRQVVECHFAGAPSLLVGQSAGSFMITPVVQQWPKLVSGVALIDPASVLCFLPDTTFNFCHSDLDHIGSLGTVSDWFKMDPAISTWIRRRFVWHRAALFAEDLKGKPWCCVLGGADHLNPAEAIRDYLMRRECSNCEVLWLDRERHGCTLLKDGPRRQAVELIERTWKRARDTSYFSEW